MDRTKYPFTMDKPLMEAFYISKKENDWVMAKKVWQLLVYYRKSENFEKFNDLQRGCREKE